MNEEIFDEIWRNGIIVLDTCTLDFIERCEVNTAKKLMDIFLLRRNQVYVPAHVKNVEMTNYFNLNKAKKTMTEIMNSLQGEIEEIANNTKVLKKVKRQKIISKLQRSSNQFSKYYFQILSKKLKDIQKFSIERIISYFKLGEYLELVKEYDDFLDSGTVKNFYHMVMSNVLEQFSEKEMISLLEEGQERRKNNIPPACGDENKIENSFGDFIIWKEILKNISKTKFSRTLFITEDKKKGNNWFDTDGVNMHSILRNEVIQLFKYDALLISDLKNFLEGSRNFINEDAAELIEYIKKNSIEVIDTVSNYLFNEMYDLLAEKTFEAISEKCDIDYSLPDLSFDISIVEFYYNINDEVEADIQLNVEFDTESFVRFGGDDWSDSSHVLAKVTIKALIDIEHGCYRDDLYTLNLDGMSIEIIDIDLDAEAPFGMDEFEEEYEEEYEEEFDVDDEGYY